MDTTELIKYQKEHNKTLRETIESLKNSTNKKYKYAAYTAGAIVGIIQSCKSLTNFEWQLRTMWGWEYTRVWINNVMSVNKIMDAILDWKQGWGDVVQPVFTIYEEIKNWWRGKNYYRRNKSDGSYDYQYNFANDINEIWDVVGVLFGWDGRNLYNGELFDLLLYMSVCVWVYRCRGVCYNLINSL